MNVAAVEELANELRPQFMHALRILRPDLPVADSAAMVNGAWAAIAGDWRAVDRIIVILLDAVVESRAQRALLRAIAQRAIDGLLRQQTGRQR